MPEPAPLPRALLLTNTVPVTNVLCALFEVLFRNFYAKTNNKLRGL
jgi:hypothetical protein